MVDKEFSYIAHMRLDLSELAQPNMLTNSAHKSTKFGIIGVLKNFGGSGYSSLKP